MSEASRNEDPLFRSEALSARREHSFGSVLIHRPWGYTVAAALALVLILLVAAFAYFGTYTRKATVTGLLLPHQGMLRLTANGTGVLAQIKVTEGQRVEQGDVLFLISGERISAAGGAQELIAQQLDQRMLLLERNRVLAEDRLTGQMRMLDSRLGAIVEESERLAEELRLLGRRVELAATHLHRQQQLVEAQFVSVAQLQQAEAELLSLQGQRQTLRRSRTNLDRERTELLAQRQEAELRHRTDLSEIDNGISLVRQEQAENDVRVEQAIVAPFSGIVTGLNAQLGQQILTGALLASLIPEDATLTAQVYVGPRQAGFIEPGQPVLMRYAAYPYQKFGMAHGTVSNVAKSPYAAQELPAHIASALQQASASAELFYRVTVELDSPTISVYGSAQSLQAGMLLEADIIQDRRRLYEWALEPIYSVTGKMSANQSPDKG
ncbi:HlyD family secretion protein [Stutzerimonas tarimensis]|uniref:HlyD family secretion protein n=1 Tax=Stutzerimonas tarimensis TaxID=1507735 RepID=A0ABV7T3S3_9GAMM